MKTEKWRRRHDVQFETFKYVLIHYTRNTHKFTSTSITLNEITLQSSMKTKYLEIILDQQLWYKEHIQQAIKKDIRAILALSSIAKCNWETSYKYVRQLFQTVIASKINYDAVIWHRSKAERDITNLKYIKQLITIQRIVMQIILECYWIISTIIMKQKSELSLTWLCLQIKMLLSIIHMQFLSKQHFIQL